MTDSVQFTIQTDQGLIAVPYAFPVGRVYVHRTVRGPLDPFVDDWVISSPSGLCILRGIPGYHDAMQYAAILDRLLPPDLVNEQDWSPTNCADAVQFVKAVQKAINAGYGAKYLLCSNNSDLRLDTTSASSTPLSADLLALPSGMR